jgi:hypothetical protein
MPKTQKQKRPKKTGSRHPPSTSVVKALPERTDGKFSRLTFLTYIGPGVEHRPVDKKSDPKKIEKTRYREPRFKRLIHQLSTSLHHHELKN